jgi:hypothetical protein
MASTPITEKIVPYALLGMTAVTGLVDAVSFLSLGRVFTANMNGECRDSGACDSARTRTVHRVLLNGALVVSNRGDIRSHHPHGARDGHTECRCPEARNPRSDDNSPDTNDHGHRRGLFDRERQQPKIGEKGSVGRRNVFGCGVGCGHHTLLDLSGLVAWDSDLRLVQCGIVSCVAHAR